MSEASEQAQDISALVVAIGDMTRALVEAHAAEKKYTEATKAASEADREQAKSASASEQALKKSQDLFARGIGGGEVAEKVAKLREAYSLASDSQQAFGTRARAAAGGVGIAARMVGGYAQQLYQAGRAGIEAEAKLGAHLQHIHQLGSAYAQVQRATAGAMDASTAYGLNQQALDRGIMASAEQLGVVSRAVRELARDRGIDQEQASSMFEAAMNGDAHAAARFGLSLSAATTSAERFRLAQQQLAQRQSGQTVVGQNVVEEANRATMSLDRASQAYSSTVLTHITGPLKVLAGMLETVPGSADYAKRSIVALFQTDATRAANAQQAAVAERQRLERLVATTNAERRLQETQAQAAADRMRQATDANSAALNDLSQYHFITDAMGAQYTALGRTTTAQEQYLRALSATMAIQLRQGEDSIAFEQRKTEAVQALTAAIRRNHDEEQRGRARHDGEIELGVLLRTSRQHGVGLNLRQRSVTVEEQIRDVRRQIRDLSQTTNESDSDFLARETQILQREAQLTQQVSSGNDQWRQRARDRRDLASAEEEYRMVLQHTALIEGELADHSERYRDETRIDYLHRVIAAQQEVNRTQDEAIATEEQHAEAQRASQDAFETRNREAHKAALEREAERRDAFTETGREWQRQANERFSQERHRAMDATSLETQVREQFGFAEEHVKTIEQTSIAAAKNAVDAFGELGSSVANAMAQAAASGDDVGAAIAKQVDDWAAAKAIQWGLQSVEAFAGAGIAWFIRPDAVPGLLASGATYAALAGAAGLASAAIPNAPAASAGGGAGGKNADYGLAASSRTDTSANAQQQAPMIFNISGFTSTESAQEGIVRALREANSRGLIELGR